MAMLLSALATAQTTVRVTSTDGSLAAVVGVSGIASLQIDGKPLSVRGAKTALVGGSLNAPGRCATQTAATIAAVGAGAVVQQRFACAVPAGSVELLVTDSYTPDRGSVAIATKIATVSNATTPFSAAVSTGLTWAAGALGGDAKVWLPWTKGCVQNNGQKPGMCFGSIDHWEPALAPEPLPAAAEHFRYGAKGPARGGQAAPRDSFTLPVVSLLGGAADIGFSLVVDPSDPLLEVAMSNS